MLLAPFLHFYRQSYLQLPPVDLTNADETPTSPVLPCGQMKDEGCAVFCVFDYRGLDAIAESVCSFYFILS